MYQAPARQAPNKIRPITSAGAVTRNINLGYMRMRSQMVMALAGIKTVAICHSTVFLSNHPEEYELPSVVP